MLPEPIRTVTEIFDVEQFYALISCFLSGHELNEWHTKDHLHFIFKILLAGFDVRFDARQQQRILNCAILYSANI